MSDERTLVTAAQAAAWCGVSDVTIRLWVHRGYLTPVVPGSARTPALYDIADVVRCERAVRHRRRTRLDNDDLL